MEEGVRGTGSANPADGLWHIFPLPPLPFGSAPVIDSTARLRRPHSFIFLLHEGGLGGLPLSPGEELPIPYTSH